MTRTSKRKRKGHLTSIVVVCAAVFCSAYLRRPTGDDTEHLANKQNAVTQDDLVQNAVAANTVVLKARSSSASQVPVRAMSALPKLGSRTEQTPGFQSGTLSPAIVDRRLDGLAERAQFDLDSITPDEQEEMKELLRQGKYQELAELAGLDFDSLSDEELSEYARLGGTEQDPFQQTEAETENSAQRNNAQNPVQNPYSEESLAASREELERLAEESDFIPYVEQVGVAESAARSGISSPTADEDITPDPNAFDPYAEFRQQASFGNVDG